MKPEELYRIEKRLQNGLNKYYLIREIFSDGRKFAASHLIKTGTVPSRAEVMRCAGMFGFDLEMKCVDKAAKYRAGILRTESENDETDIYEVERFRLMRRFSDDHISLTDLCREIAAFPGVNFSREELLKMFDSGKIPSGRMLSDVISALNIRDVVLLRKKERLSVWLVKKVRAALQTHGELAPLSEAELQYLKKRIAFFYQRANESYHPLEQACIFYDEFLHEFPDEVCLAHELFTRLALGAGYRIGSGSWNDLIAEARDMNALLELDIRKFIASEFRVHSGARQRQLDFFAEK